MKFLSSKWESNSNNKLQKWTLEGINMSDIKDIILSGNKSNFRILVYDTLVEKESTNDSIEQMKQVSYGIEYQYFRTQLNEAFKKTEENPDYAKVIISLINACILDKNEIKDDFKKLLDSIFRKAKNDPYYAEIIPSLINISILNKSEIKDSFKKLLKNTCKNPLNHDLYTAKVTPALLGTNILDKSDKVFLKDLLDNALEKSEKYSDYLTYVIPGLLSTNILDKSDKVYVKELLDDTFKKTEDYPRYGRHIIPSLLNTNIIDKSEIKENFKKLLNNIFKQAEKNPDYAEYIIPALLNMNILDKSDKIQVRKLLDNALNNIEKHTNYTQYVIPALLRTNILDKSEVKNDFKKLLDNIFKQAEIKLYYVKNSIPESINTNILDKNDRIYIKKLFNNAFKQAELKPDYAQYIIPALLNMNILDTSEIKNDFKKLLDNAFKKAEDSPSYGANIIPALINTNVINKSEIKNDFKKLLNDIFNKGVKDSDFSKFSIPVLLNMNILDKSDKIQVRKLLDNALNNIENNTNYLQYVIPALLRTNILEKSEIKNDLKRLLDDVFKKAEIDNRHWQYLFPVLINTNIFDENYFKNFNKQVFDKQYRENQELYDNIFQNLGQDIIPYLEKYFLNKKVLEDLFLISKYKIDKELFFKHIKDIISYPKWIVFWYFQQAIFDEQEIPKVFPITKDNFLDLMDEHDIFLTFEKDAWFKEKWITPWSKAWLLEKPERKDYLKPETIRTFKKFGTIIWLWIVEGSQNAETLQDFYKHMFNQISPKNSRSSILQLGEVFNLILKKEKYNMLDELSESEEGIWEFFKEFIEENKISDKWRTILTLMIAREINSSFQIYKNQEWENIVDSAEIKKILKSVLEKLKKYNEIIKKYKNLPIGTSIWMEYEVTKSIAEAYYKITGSDYKNDIETLSAYSWIAKGADAIHEIATKPTNNPYLVLLEMKLLEDLDFVDMNFEKGDYAKGSRGLHITVGWENGIKLDIYSQFIQNILIAANLWWVNSGKEITKVNNYQNIREKWDDCEALFSDKKTSCVEYRSLSIDKSEPFERLMTAIFNLNMSKQAADKYLDMKKLDTLDKIKKLKFEDQDTFKKYLEKNRILKEKIEDEKIYDVLFEFLKLIKDISNITEDHNKGFLENEVETFDYKDSDDLIRRNTNQKRFNDVIWEDKKKYYESLKIKPDSLFKEVTPELVNTFTRINNLFIKKDSANALSMFNNTRETDGGLNDDSRLTNTTSFDKIDQGLEQRNWYNIIQWASEKMITKAFQKRILAFNSNVEKIIK